MSEELLKIKWDSEEYGVPVGDVGGIICNVWSGALPLLQDRDAPSGQPIPALPAHSSNLDWEKKQTVIMYSNGIQIALIVDQVMNVIQVDEGELQKAPAAVFRILRLNPQPGQ